MKIGAQLYTLRNFCKTTEDFAETLKKVADMGYTTVQVSGTCAYEPEWLKAELVKNGLTCNLTHVPLTKFTDDPAQTALDHKVFGCKYIGLGGGPNMLAFDEDVDTMVDIVKKAAPAFKKEGVLFMYHNHDGEFTKGSSGKFHLLELAERTSADELGFTLDTYWVQHGGASVADIFETLSGRIPCVHFKDYAIVPKREVRMAPVGRGNINFEKIASICEKGGTEYIFVEQDDCYGEDPFACLKESYDYLKSIGLN